MRSMKTNYFAPRRMDGLFSKIRQLLIIFLLAVQALMLGASPVQALVRERISINDDWRFTKGDPTNNSVSLLYDVRQQRTVRRLAEAEADGNATVNTQTTTDESTNVPIAVIKQWILPTGNDFAKDAAHRFTRPEGNLGDDVAYVQPDFDDSSWQQINLPHDWAIEGPFIRSGGGGMGRLPSAGVGWYRKKLNIPADDAGKSIFFRCGRSDVVLDSVVEWPTGRRLALWLCIMAGGLDAVCETWRSE